MLGVRNDTSPRTLPRALRAARHADTAKHTMSTEKKDERLEKFTADQIEAVKLARDGVEKTNDIRLDALNAALSIASFNREVGIVYVADVLRNAAVIEKYLRGEPV